MPHHQDAGGLEPVQRLVAQACRRGETDHLRHHVVAVDQHVAQQDAHRRALVEREEPRRGRRRAAQRRIEDDAVAARELTEHATGVQARVLDRQRGHPAAAAIGDLPDHRLVAHDIEADAVGRQQRGRCRHEAGLVQRRQGDRRGTAAVPRHADPVERDRERADARIVGGLGRLARVDLGQHREGGVVDQEAAVDAKDAEIAKLHRELEQIGEIEGRIARASEDQIAPQDAALDDAVGEQLGTVAMLGAEHVEGDHRGRELGGRGRDQRQVGVELGEHQAGLDVLQHVADLGAGRALGDARRRGAAVRQRDLGRPGGRLLRLDLVDQIGRRERRLGLRLGNRDARRIEGGRFGWGWTAGTGGEQQQDAERGAPEDARINHGAGLSRPSTGTHHARSLRNMEAPPRQVLRQCVLECDGSQTGFAATVTALLPASGSESRLREG